MRLRVRHLAPNPTYFTYLLGVTFLITSTAASRSMAEEPELAVVGLRCEYLVNPLAVDHAQPRLSWRLSSEQRGVRQTSYRILVASSPEKLSANEPDLWDSDRVQSHETSNIPYAGSPLESRMQCFWKVMVWCRAGEPVRAESALAHWSMGLLEESDWTADYISYRDESPIFTSNKELFLPPAHQFRKEFQSAEGPIRRALLYATALGVYEFYLNGQRVSDHWLAPGWTDYHRRAYYRAYDVTDLLESGDNALGVWLADGWYSGYVGFGLLTGIGTEGIGRYAYGKTPSVMGQLEIEYQDGTRQIIGTDRSWKTTDNGPIQEADLLMGEFYDARREQEGWTEAGYDDQGWDESILAVENGHPEANMVEFRNPEKPGEAPQKATRKVDLGFQRPQLEAFPGEPARVTQEIKPIDVKRVAPGKFIYNLGQNFAGTVRMQLQGPADAQVTLRYGEMLYPDGRLMTENLRKARAIDRYILKGDSQGETYIPRFTFHGFQYVEVSLEPAVAIDTAPQITGLVLHSDTRLTSTFECSDPMANRLFQNIVWTQRANFLDLPTDCPQRDERMGWTGDAQVYIGTAAYNADVAAFYSKWLRELMESQRPSGVFPGYAPFPFQHGWDFGTAWCDAGVICPWTIWQVYGDTRIIEQCWEPMTRFMQWRQQTSRDHLGIAHGNSWGDWLAQGAATPLEYIDTVYFAISAKMMADMAHAVGRTDEMKKYRQLLGNIQEAFGKKYLQPDGTLTVSTQTAYALALFAELIPPKKRRAAGATLAAMIQENGTRMSTGFLGTRALLPALTNAGQHDLAVFLFQSREFPSWGYEVEQGATTIWERWDSYTKEDGFGRHNAAMNSFAHYSFGAVCEWMFQSLAGIQSHNVGFNRILIRPRPPAPNSNAERKAIHWVKASYDHPRGKIVSNWSLQEDCFELEVTVPPNVTATVIVPASDLANITESGNRVADNPAFKGARFYRTAAILSVESGAYKFRSEKIKFRTPNRYKTSPPPDLSTNPDHIDLEKATLLSEWDFRTDDAYAQWSQRNNLERQRRDATTYLVATGGDPQIETLLQDAVTGKLALEIRASSAEKAEIEIFWAGPKAPFQAKLSTRRAIRPAKSVQQYLFAINANSPLQKLRLDPMQNTGELAIESIRLYRLAEE